MRRWFSVNDKQLRSFVDIVNTKSFSKSEENLFLSRQALKKQIDSLESELGFTLLVRTSKGVIPTAQGKIFYEHAKEMIGSYDKLVGELRAPVSDDITLTIGRPAQQQCVLEPAFWTFAKEYPNVRQNFVKVSSGRRISFVTDGTVDIVESIINEQFDPTKLGKLKIADLHYYCIMSYDHPLANKESISISDLNGYTVYIRFNGNEKVLQEFRETCPGVTVRNSPGEEFSEIYNACYSGDIFVSRTNFTFFPHPLVRKLLNTVTLNGQYLIYRLNHTQAVSDFIECTKKIFPIDEN